MSEASTVRPEITVNSFAEKDVKDYITQLDTIVEQYGSDQPILIKIDSYGGAIFGLSYLYEHLMSMNNPLVTYTASKAMSAGAILLSAAAKPGMRVASPNATIMIHEIQAGTWGDIKNIENEVEHFKAENEKWMAILAKSMGLKSGADIRKLLKDKGHELYLTAQQAKELKVVDDISYLTLAPVRGWEIMRKNRVQPKKK